MFGELFDVFWLGVIFFVLADQLGVWRPKARQRFIVREKPIVVIEEVRELEDDPYKTPDININQSKR